MTILKITPADAQYAQLLALRDEVLRIPLGLSLEQFDFASDATDIILTAFAEGENGEEAMAGCVMLSPKKEGEIKLRQMAVKPGLQRAGTGTALVAAAEQAARDAGFRIILLHARFKAVGFYEKLGYAREGRMFCEVGIPHIKMNKLIA